MSFTLRWATAAEQTFNQLRGQAERAAATRRRTGKTKSSRQEGLFKQVAKTVQLLAEDPRHPSLNTHQYHSLEHPFEKGAKVFEAYAQHRTLGAYRVFWCYGPRKGEVTIIAITPHP